MNAQALKNFATLSQRYGRDVLCVQGSGGNTSCKLDSQWMAIKASGTFMKNITETEGYVVIDYQKVRDYLLQEKSDIHTPDHTTDERLNDIIDASLNRSLSIMPKASIEAGMHALLKRYVCHIHPVYPLVLLCIENPENIIAEIFNGYSFHFVDYHPPGLYLAKGILEKISYNPDPEILFLKNHGVVIHSDSLDRIYELTDAVNGRTVAYLNDKNAYGCFHPVTDLMTMKNTKDIFPDTVVFKKLLNDKFNTMGFQMQQAVIENYSAAVFVLDTIAKLDLKPGYLSDESIHYIENLSGEKYRQGKMSAIVE